MGGGRRLFGEPPMRDITRFETRPYEASRCLAKAIRRQALLLKPPSFDDARVTADHPATGRTWIAYPNAGDCGRGPWGRLGAPRRDLRATRRVLLSPRDRAPRGTWVGAAG